MYRYFTLSTAIAGILLATTSCQEPASNTAIEKNNVPTQTVNFSGHLPIAYVEVDSLLSNYNLAKDLNEQMLTRQENARATVNEKGRQLEKKLPSSSGKSKTMLSFRKNDLSKNNNASSKNSRNCRLMHNNSKTNCCKNNKKCLSK